MTKTRKVPRLVGAAIGAVLVAAGVISVFVMDWEMEEPEEQPPVRPLKTMVVGEPFVSTGRSYPGKVRANREVDLAFQVAGPLIELPVKKGQEVDEGELLARLDPRDFGNELAAAAAESKRSRAHLERVQEAVKTGAVSGTDLTDAQAAFETAEAKKRIAAKALEDTYLHAPFSGVIANTFVDNFENVPAKQPILSLQDVSSVEVEVNLPEERVALASRDKDRDRFQFVATFDYLPGRRFDVTLKEFATEADPATQTYLATFVMPAPTDVIILPGMTATVTEHPKGVERPEDVEYAVPVDAVPVDGVGTYFVWKLEENADGTSNVHRVDVKVGEMMGDHILVVEGLKNRDRIATAGVHLLQDGQRVRLLEPKAGADFQ